MPSTTTKRVGLRFRTRDALVLREIAQRIRGGELHNRHATLFDQAADSAATGEPLVVVCNSQVEAIAMADGFTMYGVSRPAVEALSSR